MSLLKDNSCVMVHSTPCYEYLYEYARFHLIFFTGCSLYKLCEQIDLAPYNRYSEFRNASHYMSYHFKISASEK